MSLSASSLKALSSPAMTSMSAQLPRPPRVRISAMTQQQLPRKMQSGPRASKPVSTISMKMPRQLTLLLHAAVAMGAPAVAMGTVALAMGGPGCILGIAAVATGIGAAALLLLMNAAILPGKPKRGFSKR